MASMSAALTLAFIMQICFNSPVHCAEELVEKPKEDTTADVLFVGSYTEHAQFAIYANGKRQQLMTDGRIFSPGESNSVRLDARTSHLIATVVTPPTVRRGERKAPLGVIASLEQHTRTKAFAGTDGTWRCRHGSAAMRRLKDKKTGRKWFHTDYDDSHWPEATVLGAHGDKPWEVLMDVSSDAKWIWAESSDYSATVLCRGWVSHNPDTLYLSADSHFEAFADGRRLGNGSIWDHTYSFTIPGMDRHTLAVHAWQDTAIPGRERAPGVIASIQTPSPPHGVSSPTWKCKRRLTDDEKANWMKASFNDSKWLTAKSVESHHGEYSEKGVRIDISQHAHWVWAAGKAQPGERNEAYCRGSRMSSNMHALKGSARGKIPGASSTGGDRDSTLGIKYLHPRAHFEKIQEVDMSRLDTVTFFRDFLSKGRPFVVRGGIKSWPAYGNWTDKYLNEKIGSDETQITYAPNDVFYFYSEKREMTDGTVGEFLRKYRDPDRKKNLYLAQHPLQSEDGTATAIRKDVRQPPFSKFMYLEDAFLWMGGGNQVTPVHFDNSENIMCMVAGRKHIRVFEPAMSNYLYPVVQNRHTAVTSRMKNLSNPDLKAFPDFAKASSVEVTIEAGDMFFLPSYWWHEVTSYDRNIAVNWWFNTHSFVLDSVYNQWLQALPQTQWGLEQQQMRDEAARQEAEQEAESSRRGRIRRDGEL